MIAITLIPEEEEALAVEAQEAGRSAEDIARELLLDWIEERQDIRDARRVIAEMDAGKQKTTPLEEVLAEYGMAPGTG